MTAELKRNIVVSRVSLEDSGDETFDIQFKIIERIGQAPIDMNGILVGIIFDDFLDAYRIIIDGKEYPYKLVRTLEQDIIMLENMGIDITLALEDNKLDEAIASMRLTAEELKECRGPLKSWLGRRQVVLSATYHQKSSVPLTGQLPTNSPMPGRGRDGTTESIFLGRARKRSPQGSSRGSKVRFGVKATRQKPKT